MPALWDKTLWYDADEASYWTNQTFLDGTVATGVDPSTFKLSQVQFVFARTVATTVHEDVALFTLHLSGEALAGTPGVALDATQAAAAETDFLTWWTTVRAVVPTRWTLKEYRWSTIAMDGPRGPTGLVKPSPVWRITSLNSAGTSGSASMPDQVAQSVTFRTASRRHWGRVYLPGISIGAVGSTSNGHATSTQTDTVASAFRTLANDLHANAVVTNLGVWSPRYRGFLALTELRVDDVFDVIRSRRPKFATYAKSYTS